jgi:AraC family transcriptional regulator
MGLYLAKVSSHRGVNVANVCLRADSALNATDADLWLRRILTLLESVLGELRQEPDAVGALAEAASLLRQQLDGELEAGAADGRGRLLAWQARKVRDYIDTHLAEPVRVADLCSLLQLSEAHFSRSFRRTFGESPHAFLVRQRLRRAERYMLETGASLSEIALQCGFTDQAHLSKHFREHTGRTPGSWRRARRMTTDIGSLESDLSREFQAGNPAAATGRKPPERRSSPVREPEEVNRLC